jgi:hypothetical protein
MECKLVYGQSNNKVIFYLISEVIDKLAVLAVLAGQGLAQLKHGGVNAHGAVRTKHLISFNEKKGNKMMMIKNDSNKREW